MIALLSNPVFMATVAAIVFATMLLLATAASPFIAVISQQLAVNRKKTFYDKFAKQIASMGALIGALLLTAIAAGGIQIALKQPELVQGPARLPIFITMGCAVFAYAMLAIYSLTWRPLRKNKGLHKLLGLLASAAMLLAFSLGAGIVRILLAKGHPLPVDAPLQETMAALFAVPVTTFFWPSVIQCGLVAAMSAGMFGLVYLILRRNRDDFGRDYYKFALPCCARWAAVPAILQLAATVYGFWRLVGKGSKLDAFDPTIWCWSAALLLPLIAATLWYILTASQTPMRHKVSIFLVIPFMLIAATAQVVVMLFQLGMV